jgi:hypothetical protein
MTIATARIDRTPTYNDLEITRLVHRTLADVQDAGRFGDGCGSFATVKS